MDMLWPTIAAVGALLVAGGALIWRRHRARMAEIQRRLEWSEESRLDLEERAQAIDARLSEMSMLLQSQQQTLESARELAERRAALDALIDQASATRAKAQAPSWADTQPLADDYARTRPGELQVEEPLRR